MAVDTALKRYSLIGLGDGDMFHVPDGAIDSHQERYIFEGLYGFDTAPSSGDGDDAIPYLPPYDPARTVSRLKIR